MPMGSPAGGPYAVTLGPHISSDQPCSRRLGVLRKQRRPAETSAKFVLTPRNRSPPVRPDRGGNVYGCEEVLWRLALVFRGVSLPIALTIVGEYFGSRALLEGMSGPCRGQPPTRANSDTAICIDRHVWGSPGASNVIEHLHASRSGVCSVDHRPAPVEAPGRDDMTRLTLDGCASGYPLGRVRAVRASLVIWQPISVAHLL